MRIQCNCGKLLNVSEALVGKKIKCPSCSAVQLVKADSATQNTGIALPKKQKVQPDDDEEPRPRYKKKALQNNNTKVLLIAGGVGATVVVAAIVVVAVLLFRDEEKPAAPAVVKPPAPKVVAPKAEVAALKLFVPHQPGDKREVTALLEYKLDSTADSDAALPPEAAEQLARENIHEIASLKGELQTLKVNAQGEETEVKLTINELTMARTIGDKTTTVPFVPNGTEAIGTLGGNAFQWRCSDAAVLKGLNRFLSDLLLFRYANQPEAEADVLFGTEKPRQVGVPWHINADKLARYFKSADLFAEPDGKAALKASGTGVRGGVGPDGIGALIDFNFKIKASGQNEKGATISSTLNVIIQVPSDGSTGPVKRIDKLKMEGTGEIPLPGLDSRSAKMKLASSVDTRVDFKYLGNFPLAPQDTYKAEPVQAQLSNLKVQWMEPEQAVNVSVNFTLLGNAKPKAEASYILYVKMPDSGGFKKSYMVQSLSGAGLTQSGVFSNPSVAVSVPKTNRSGFCDIVLVEKTPSDLLEVEVARADKVPVIGINPPASTRVAFELSNHKVELIGSKKMRFTVDYTLTSNKPDPKKKYQLIVNMEGKAKVQAIPFESKGDKLSEQDTIVKELTFDVPVGTKFSMSLIESDGTSSPPVTVSNVLKGKVEQGTDNQPLQIQLSAIASRVPGAVQPAIKKGGATAKQQILLQLTLTWNVTAGEINKKANYSVVVDLKGGKAGAVGRPPLYPSTVPGTQFQKSASSIPVSLPYNGETNFDVYIVEQAPGQPPTQPPPKVSNVFAGKIQ